MRTRAIGRAPTPGSCRTPLRIPGDRRRILPRPSRSPATARRPHIGALPALRAARSHPPASPRFPAPPPVPAGPRHSEASPLASTAPLPATAEELTSLAGHRAVSTGAAPSERGVRTSWTGANSRELRPSSGTGRNVRYTAVRANRAARTGRHVPPGEALTAIAVRSGTDASRLLRVGCPGARAPPTLAASPGGTPAFSRPPRDEGRRDRRPNGGVRRSREGLDGRPDTAGTEP